MSQDYNIESNKEQQKILENIQKQYFDLKYKYQYLLVAITSALIAYSIKKIDGELICKITALLVISTILSSASVLCGLASLIQTTKFFGYYHELTKLKILPSGISTDNSSELTRLENLRKESETKVFEYTNYQFRLFLLSVVLFIVYYILSIYTKYTNQTLQTMKQHNVSSTK